MKKNFMQLKSLFLLPAILFVFACGNESPDSKKSNSVQDTAMPGQQNDGYPYTNPTTRSDTVHSHVDTTVPKSN